MACPRQGKARSARRFTNGRLWLRKAAEHPSWLWRYGGFAGLVRRRCGGAPDGAHCGNSGKLSGKSRRPASIGAKGILRNVAVRWLAQKNRGLCFAGELYEVTGKMLGLWRPNLGRGGARQRHGPKWTF